MTTKNKKGFTIIEVVLVLAIAGLIFLMVFIALPALQRSQRNTQREDDIARFLTAVNDYQTNNAGKTPLTSSELIRALFLESGTGLRDDERNDIAKEWDIMTSDMGDDMFWAIWNTRRFDKIPTRIDFLFSIVCGCPLHVARLSPLAIYLKFEKWMKKLSGVNKAERLRNAWEEVLRGFVQHEAQGAYVGAVACSLACVEKLYVAVLVEAELEPLRGVVDQCGDDGVGHIELGGKGVVDFEERGALGKALGLVVVLAADLKHNWYLFV